MVQICMGLLTCRSILGIKYINDDTNLLCFTPEHLFYVYFICTPVLIGMIIIFPLTILIRLYRCRNSTQLIGVKLSMGFFLIGLNDDRK